MFDAGNESSLSFIDDVIFPDDSKVIDLEHVEKITSRSNDQEKEKTVTDETDLSKGGSGDPGEKVETTKTEASDSKKDEEGGGGPELIEFKENVILKRIADEFKESGIEIAATDTAKNFLENLSSAIIEKEISNPESGVYSKVRNIILDENGIDDRVLAIASGVPFGIDRNEYLDLYALQDFVQDDFSVEDKDGLKTLFYTYHTLKKIGEEDIETYVETDLGNANKELIDARKAFIEKYTEDQFSSINKIVESRKKIAQEEKDEKVKLINSFVEKGEIDGVSFSAEQFQEFFSAMFNRDQEIELPDGSKKKVTALDKKKYEFQKSNYAKALLNDMLFFFDKEDEISQIKREKKGQKEQGGFMRGLESEMKKYGVDSKEVDAGKDFDNTKSGNQRTLAGGITADEDALIFG